MKQDIICAGTPDAESLSTAVAEFLHTVRPERQRLFDYYRGEQSVPKGEAVRGRPNNLLRAPFPRYITEVHTGYFLGVPPTLSFADEAAGMRFAALSRALRLPHLLFDIGRDLSICGAGFLLVWAEQSGVKVCRCDPSTCFAIRSGGEGVLRFYLRQSIGAQGVTVTCSPAGLLTGQDIEPMTDRVLSTTGPSRTAEVTAAELQTYLDSLPRLLTEDLTIILNGACETAIQISDFYGSGSLHFTAQTLGDAEFKLGVRVCNCSTEVFFENLRFSHLTANSTPLILLYIDKDCAFAHAEHCSFTGKKTGGVRNDRGIQSYRGSKVYLYDCTITETLTAVEAQFCCTVSVEGGSYSNNDHGAHAAHGSSICLSGGAPDLLGGSTNVKVGGFIVRQNGSLL